MLLIQTETNYYRYKVREAWSEVVVVATARRHCSRADWLVPRDEVQKINPSGDSKDHFLCRLCPINLVCWKQQESENNEV